MIGVPQLPGQMYANLNEVEKVLIMRLTAYLEEMAREVNNKTETQMEDIMWWVTRP